MSRLQLSIATEAYDRVLPIRDGRVQIQGCDASYLVVRHEELFARAFHHTEYDVCELSMSSYLISVARGENAYVAVPVFPSRLFRHSAIYLHAAADIARPEDLAGKRVGVPEYQITAALWVRGLLDDGFGVPPTAMTWYRGGLHEPGRVEKLPLSLPADIVVNDIGPEQTLDQLLRDGAIDALISARAPHAFLAGDPRVRRLFPNYRSEERRYFKATGLFPIMHVLAVRKALLAEHPWLANAVLDAFTQAKDMAVRDYSDTSALRVTLPWFAAELDETRALMGADVWPYGIGPNRHALERMIDYAVRHGTIDRRLALDEVFAPSTLLEHKT